MGCPKQTDDKKSGNFCGIKKNNNSMNYLRILQEYTIICKVSFTVQISEQMVRLYVDVSNKAFLHIFRILKGILENENIYKNLDLLKSLSSKNLKHLAVSYISRDNVSNSDQI